MKNILLLAIGSPVAAIILGIKKIYQVKSIINQLQTKLVKIHKIQLDVLKNQASFLADMSITNPTETELNVNTATLISLKRVLFYDLNNELLAIAHTHIDQINIAPGKSLQLINIPFQTKITNGISKIQGFLKGNTNKEIRIEIELEAFGKRYRTGLNDSIFNSINKTP